MMTIVFLIQQDVKEKYASICYLAVKVCLHNEAHESMEISLLMLYVVDNQDIKNNTQW